MNVTEKLRNVTRLFTIVNEKQCKIEQGKQMRLKGIKILHENDSGDSEETLDLLGFDEPYDYYGCPFRRSRDLWRRVWH